MTKNENNDNNHRNLFACVQRNKLRDIWGYIMFLFPTYRVRQMKKKCLERINCIKYSILRLNSSTTNIFCNSFSPLLKWVFMSSFLFRFIDFLPKILNTDNMLDIINIKRRSNFYTF